MEMLREKIKGLEYRIMEMIRHGQENMALTDRLHRWTRAILCTAEPGALPDVLVATLRHEFLIPQAGLRLWGTAEVHADETFARDVTADLRAFASSLALPYCGVNSGFEAVGWLPDPAAVLSLAMIPLRRDAQTDAFGLLVCGSPDPTRYSAEMGTEFLQRIGEIASAALQRLVPVAA